MKPFIVSYNGMAQGHLIVFPCGYHRRFIDDGKNEGPYEAFLRHLSSLPLGAKLHGSWAELPDTPEVRQLIAAMDAHEAAKDSQL